MQIPDIKKSKNHEKKGLNPIIAGAAGAALGAGVAVAASQALKDKKTRDKVKKTFTDVKDRTVNYVQNFNSDADVKSNLKKVKKVARQVKKAANKTGK